MKSQYDYDIIRDYLHGILDREKSQEIGELIRKDEIARTIADGILRLDHKFNGNDSDVDAYLEKFHQQQLRVIERHNAPQKLMQKTWFRVAASILVLMAAGIVLYTLNQPDLDSLIAEELSQPYPVSNLFRNNEDISAADKGYEFYAAGNYAEASRYFDRAATQEKDIASVTFYNALCNLYTGNYSKTMMLLNTAVISDSRYAQQAKWYQSLALVKSGNTREAKEILEDIENNEQHFKHERALEILEELK